MDSINIYPVLATWQPDKKGLCTIHLSVDLNGKRAAFPSLKRKVLPADWDTDNKRVLRSNAKHSLINTLIKRECSRLEAELLELQIKSKALTHKKIKDHFKGLDSDSFILFFKNFLRDSSANRKLQGETVKVFSENNIKKWTTEFNRLNAYTNGVLSFHDITPKWLKEYERHCAKTLDKNTSLPVTMSRLLQVLRKAGRAVFDMDTIRDYKPPVYINPDRPYLTLAETEKIANAIYSGQLDHDPALRAVACYFLIECWAGLRFSDWHRFSIEKLIDTDSIKATAVKNKQPIYIPVHNSPALSRIIAYIQANQIAFNYTEQYTNRQLKILSGITNMPVKLTTHVGRHTCATLLLGLRYTTVEISQWLGISEKVVHIYAKKVRHHLALAYEQKGGI